MTLDKNTLINLGVTHFYEKENGQVYFGVSSLKKHYSGLHVKDVDCVSKEVDGREIKMVVLTDVDATNAQLKEEDGD